MDFIFMLTHNDRTVGDCLELAGRAIACGVRHIGCKDIGADRDTLDRLADAIGEAGGTSYLELVGTSAADCMAAAGHAILSGFDRLLGGADPVAMRARCKGRIEYFPFGGRIGGHPVSLHGSASAIAADCRRLSQDGHPGVDLLLYRAVDAVPNEILTQARRATAGRLIVAGRVNSPERIQALRMGGVDAFTIGSAILEGSIFPDAESLEQRIDRVLALCR